MRRLTYLWMIALIGAVACNAAAREEIMDPAVAAEDPDFHIQGEYLGEAVLPNGEVERLGAQVVALSQGRFDAVVYRGGLPGDGWKRGDRRFTMAGTAEELEGRQLVGSIADGVLTIADREGEAKAEMKRTVRKSPTLGKEPPEGARVLFDGTHADKWNPPRLTELGTLHAGVVSKPTFNSYKLHLEFYTSWMPYARGQARANSGVYLHDCYELQVLDSFGSEGRDNECGGFYQLRDPDVNMAFPPMQWQTFDIDFTAPEYDEEGNKTANARVTVKHNGVVIHDDYELPRGTPGRQPEGPGPRPIHLQEHGNKVQYGNIWLIEK